MRHIARLEHKFDFHSVPTDWNLVSVNLDWSGEPLLLFNEGPESIYTRQQVPTAHHIVYLDAGQAKHVTVESSAHVFPWAYNLQRFDDGWLIVESRGGAAHVLDQSGSPRKILQVGDAINHAQTTRDGHIWVGYFDEGVYGDGIGTAGLVCFDSDGAVAFKYSDLAQKNEVPFIDDCYTLNVTDEDVYVSYYSDFPLVQLRRFAVENLWSEFGSNNAVAVRTDKVIKFSAYGPMRATVRSLGVSSDERPLEFLMPNGEPLPQRDRVDDPTTYFRPVARGSRAYVYDDKALYEIPNREN